MPASARLIQKLQEAFGREATEDLVTWVGEASVVNRAEVRELADLYFARFDAKQEERIVRAEAKMEERLAGVRLEIAGLRAELAAQGRDQMKWMFVFWIGTITPLAGLIIALHRL